jgi:hypothetical protein
MPAATHTGYIKVAPQVADATPLVMKHRRRRCHKTVFPTYAILTTIRRGKNKPEIQFLISSAISKMI